MADEKVLVFYVYGGVSPTGHVNVGFYSNGELDYVSGAQANINNYIVDLVSGFSVIDTPPDGYYAAETGKLYDAQQNGTVVGGSVPVSAASYEAALAYARSLEGSTFDYSLINNNCVTYAQELYEMTGGEGSFSQQIPAEGRPYGKPIMVQLDAYIYCLTSAPMEQIYGIE